MRKAYLKSTGRLFLKHIVRLLSISAIFVVTVSLISGLGDVEGDIKKSINTSYVEDNIHDLTITGVTSAIDLVENALNEDPDFYEIKDRERFYYFDMKSESNQDYAYRTEFRDFVEKNNKVDKLEVIEGHLPEAINQVVVERPTKDINQEKYEIGQSITINVYPLQQKEYAVPITATVVGVVKNPRLVGIQHEHSQYFSTGKNEFLNNVYYFDISALNDTLGAFPSLAVTLKDRTIFNAFSTSFDKKIKQLVAKIETVLDGYKSVTSIIPLNLPYLDYGLWSLNMYAEKVGIIASIFIVLFILIAILVIYSTMSRLLDEERSSMAVLKTMGYSNFAIAIRYMSFSLVAGIIGVAISILPARLVSQVILNAFGIQYAMKQISFPLVGKYFFLLSGAILLISTILIAIKSIKTANKNPVDLLTYKAPKAGKKILMERIKPIWTRLSFKFKSTWRNIFLFKGRLVMTVLSIIASTVMVFASFALLNCTLLNRGMDALLVISVVLLIFSAALCALVIYNITNINISERTREIATLMVLGYRDNEVTGYVYREIYILTIIGALLGVPIGYGFIYYVFDTINVPAILNLDSVEWWSYVVSPIITCIFAFLAMRLLHKKIIKTDMNESLKVLE